VNGAQRCQIFLFLRRGTARNWGTLNEQDNMAGDTDWNGRLPRVETGAFIDTTSGVSYQADVMFRPPTFSG
jgi:hypothetical protein